jgi:hypothetical protein
VVNLGDLVASLVGEARPRNPREGLLSLLGNISASTKPHVRIVIAIDAAKYLRSDTEDDWIYFVERLPQKIKIVLTQRTDDIFGAESSLRRFQAERIAVRVPKKALDALSSADVRLMIAEQLGAPGSPFLIEALNKYHGHPYATAAALTLVAQGTPPESLPSDPTPDGVASQQWQRVQKTDGNQAVAALKTF